MTRAMHRLSAWLLLVLACIEGGMTTQSFVLCTEPGGDVFVEAGFGGLRCGGCAETASVGSPAEGRAADTSECCPCTDVVLGLGANRSQVAREPLLLQLLWLAAMKDERPVHAALDPSKFSSRARPSDRAPETAPALVGSVVLRV